MEALQTWLARAGVHASDLEQDFASGYRFAQLLHAFALQPDLAEFQDKGSKPDAVLHNYTHLQPTMAKLGVTLDVSTAQALINKTPGMAPKVLLAIKQRLDSHSTNLQTLEHASKRQQQLGVRTSLSRGLLEAQTLKSQHEAYDASKHTCLDDVLRTRCGSPNALMEALHLRRYADEGARQAAVAAQDAAAAAAAASAERAAFRDGLRGRLCANRTDRAAKLQRDEAVHAAILRHQDDLERQELRVELALSELSRQRKADRRGAAAAEAAAGIDAFEMTLKRLGGGAAGGGASAAPGALAHPQQGEAPMATLGRIREFAPTVAKLADSREAYLGTIKARRQEEAAGRKEREVRRRRMLAEQQAARAAAEERMEADCVREVLARQSGEEQKLAGELQQLQQEQAHMEAATRQREAQHAALKQREWEDTLRREAEQCRSLRAAHAASMQQELAMWRQQQSATAATASAGVAGFGRDTAWQLVQLAERVVEYRAATGGRAVPLRDWRAWLALFLAGDPELGSPIINATSQPAAAGAQEAPAACSVLNAAELDAYLRAQGDWAQAAAVVATSAAAMPAQAVPAAPTAGAENTGGSNVALAEVVADLAALAQKLQRNGWKATPSPGPEAGAAAAAAGEQELQADAAPAAATQPPAAAGSSDTKPPTFITAAEAAAGSGAAPGADMITAIPLKLAVVGAPFAGKSSVAQHIAQAYGLKLLVPQQLLEQAVAAAEQWQQLQQQSAPSEGGGKAADAQQGVQLQQPALPQLVQLGQQAAEQLQEGGAASDALIVQLLVWGMQEARHYVPPAPEPAQPELPVKSSGKPAAKGASASSGGAGKTEPSGAGAAGSGRCGTNGGAAAPAVATPPPAAPAPAHMAAAAVAAQAAGALPPLPPHLAAGAAGRGFVLDGFPATQAQAALLEQALTGLDLAAETALHTHASRLAPPPLSRLPQLARPLVSGLDAVLLLECGDVELAVARVLGCRLDPVTGRVYHLDFDPPPINTPGLVERLVPLASQGSQQVTERLARHAASCGPLIEWLARFSTLRRPLDATLLLPQVVSGAADVVNGLLLAKSAAQAARAAADAATQAQAAADEARQLARASQAAAEAAARDLLASKRAELHVLPLLTGGKTPDPAAAELVKAQAAARCADQLKACSAASADAAAQAQAAQAAADAAAAAVLDCRKSLGDAAVSATAQAEATKAAAQAAAAAAAASEAASKAQAAKQLADGLCADAEKWAAAAELPATDAPPAGAAPASTAAAVGRPSSAMPGKGAATAAAAAAAHAAAAATAAAGTAGSGAPPAASSKAPPLSLVPPVGLPAELAALLHAEWVALEGSYVEGMGAALTGLRQAHSLALNQAAADKAWFGALLAQPDRRQELLGEFVGRFNAVEPDMRKATETKAELLLRAEELRDALWGLCDAKHEAAEAARARLAAESTAVEHVGLLGQHFGAMAQTELDRYLATCSFLHSYCHASHGVFNAPVADKLGGAAHNVLAPGSSTDGLGAKADAARASIAPAAGAGAAAAGQAAPHLAALQQRLPQLAAALRSASAAAVSVHSSALAAVSETQHRAAAAAANTTTTANAAAAAAAASAAAAAAAAAASAGTAQGSAPANGGSAHKGAASTGAGAPAATAKGAAAAAAATTKLAAAAEDAAAAAATAAAVARSLPGAAVLAAVHAELQGVLGAELQLLQQRLALLGAKAAAMADEVAALYAATSAQHAEQSHARYVAECGAVAALERVVKAAAAAGQPLAHDLRLEQDTLVVDATQPLVPPPPVAPPARPPTPPLPPGVLSMEQLADVAAALAGAEDPAGFMAGQKAVDLLLQLATQGTLPAAWRELDALRLMRALAPLDPALSGYLDWRCLLLALAAAAVPSLHAATPADVAALALQADVADGDCDGFLTRAEFEGLRWWFQPQAEEQGAAAAADVDRGRRLCGILWDAFKQSHTPGSAAASLMSSRPCTAPVEVPATAAAAAAADAAAAGGGAPQQAPCPAGEQPVDAVPVQALLLYLCPDRDLCAGITKAAAAATQSAAPAAALDADAVLRMCYPLVAPEQAAAIARAPVSRQQVAAAVAAAAAAAIAATAAPRAPSPAPAAGTHTGGKGGDAAPAGARRRSGPGNTAAGGSESPAPASGAAPAAPAAAADTQQQQAPVPPALTASQLMYGAACERIVTLLLHRYQLHDVFVGAWL